MKLAAALLIGSFLALPGFAEAADGQCGKGKNWVSCSEVDGAKRDGFCTKRAEPSEEFVAKVCSKARKKYAKGKKSMDHKKARKPKPKRTKPVPKQEESTDDAEV